MRSASLSDIKKELQHLSKDEIVELCVRLTKYRKENKELLNYLLFEVGNEADYVLAVKTDVAEAFEAVNVSSLYLAKKTIRRALRIVNRYARYSAKPETELELLIFYCQQLISTGIDVSKSKVLSNLYGRQLLRIEKNFDLLHHDLQFDFSDSIVVLKAAFRKN